MLDIEQNTDHSTWQNLFLQLPASARTCRHEFGIYVHDRVCENFFNCADCVIHKNVERLEASRRAHGWREKPPVDEVYGISVPADRLYHRGHTWVKEEANGTYSVGIDDFGTRLIGKPEGVELPDIGTDLEVNEPAWRVKTRGIGVPILSPISGRVFAIGSNENGWYLKIRPSGNGNTTKHLLKGAEIKRWMMKEIERLQVSLSNESLGVSIADGGVLLEDLPASYPDADWGKVYRDMFLQG